MSYRTRITQSQLREGALLGTIAHAVWIVNHPEFAFEQSWDGDVYNVNDSSGSVGSIAFSEREAVGVFFTSEFDNSSIDVTSLFEGMPVDREVLKDEALEYMYLEVEGKSQQRVTAAFWTEDGQVVASEPWTDVDRKGGHLIRVQLLPVEDAFVAWEENYGFSQEQVALVKRIYSERTQKDSVVKLDEEVVAQLTRHGDSGLAYAVELFNSIGIRL
ncbi:hypothetical protein [Haladaptatus sp. DFWS20]|uniref:hypothetical protein n=1 Tax=Haladaptatus sp. DFWS20 TaxID=3403467 RepID=UPI003EB945B7